MTSYVVVVRWDTPEDGVAVFGPYPTRPHAETALATHELEDDFLNEGELPDDVTFDICPITPVAS